MPADLLIDILKGFGLALILPACGFLLFLDWYVAEWLKNRNTKK